MSKILCWLIGHKWRLKYETDAKESFTQGLIKEKLFECPRCKYELIAIIECLPDGSEGRVKGVIG